MSNYASVGGNFWMSTKSIRFSFQPIALHFLRPFLNGRKWAKIFDKDSLGTIYWRYSPSLTMTKESEWHFQIRFRKLFLIWNTSLRFNSVFFFRIQSYKIKSLPPIFLFILTYFLVIWTKKPGSCVSHGCCSVHPYHL